MKRIRTSIQVMLMLVLALLVIVGTQTTKASSSTGPAATGSPTLQTVPFVTSVEPVACVADEALVSPIKVTGSGLEPATAGGCKACKDRPWCGCTYQGHPRISCNPCCYQAYPYPICFD